MRFVFVLLACALRAPHAWALSVDPSIVEQRAAPGAALEGAFRVRNETDQPVAVRVEMESIASRGYLPLAPAQWLALTPERLELAPGQTRDLSYRIRVPAQAAGELAAEVVFVQDMTSAGLQVRFGMAVYVSIEDTERVSLEMERMELRVGGDDSVSAWMQIANHGNVHCRPEGLVQVADASGGVMDRQPLTRGMPAPPSGSASFSVPMPSVRAAPGAYRLTAEVGCHTVAGLPVQLTATRFGQITESRGWINRD